MNKDILSTVVKRSFSEILNQINKTPIVVIPFAFVGLFVGNIITNVINFIIIFSMIAYIEYKKILNENKN